MENKEPLSPHIQIYRWHISSLVSISHRITGVINIVAITFICLWASLLLLGEINYETIDFFLMLRRPPRSKQGVSSAASDVYKRQVEIAEALIKNNFYGK